jgi:hypothetical protein
MSTLVVGPVTGGVHGWPFGAAAFDLGAMGYVEQEWFLEGDAQCYAHAPGTGRSFDGLWEAEPADRLRYKTRLLIRRPADPKDFNGTVVLFWSNVSVGFEIFTGESPELYRGFAFVGVTTQRVAVHSYPQGPQHGLRAWDPGRYGTLEIPSDDAAYDIFTQAASVVGPKRPDGQTDPLAGFEVRRVLAFGASQSAGRLATYINAIQPIAHQIDGFLLDVYFGNGAILARRALGGAEIAHVDQITTLVKTGMPSGGHVLRDNGVPIFVVNSESEAISYFPVRQTDNDTYRFWELAGYAHGTVPKKEGLASSWERDLGVTTHPLAPSSGYNTLSLDPVRSAALHHMHIWMRDGTSPPLAPGPIEIAGDPPQLQRDEHGNARGGIRMPDLEVPRARHSGSAADGTLSLFGSTVPFTEAKLRSLYPSDATVAARFDEAVKSAVAQGFLLDVDAASLEAPHPLGLATSPVGPA